MGTESVHAAAAADGERESDYLWLINANDTALRHSQPANASEVHASANDVPLMDEPNAVGSEAHATISSRMQPPEFDANLTSLDDLQLDMLLGSQSDLMGLFSEPDFIANSSGAPVIDTNAFQGQSDDPLNTPNREA